MTFSEKYDNEIKSLLASPEPSVRYKVLVNVLNEDPASFRIKKLQEEIRKSQRVRQLLSSRNSSGEIASRRDVYDKWQGAHWILASLADIGYPAGDETLLPVKEQILEHWLDEFYFREFNANSKADCYRKDGVPVLCGRHRRCASQQGNALWFLLKLGLDDTRIDMLAERLLHWQWPDGGWNCDKNPSAETSSFMETLLPMRGLALHRKLGKSKAAGDSAARASEVFLSRQMYMSISSGEVIHPEFTKLHYPLYWHYDIIGGLKVLAEAGLTSDTRCTKALELLEAKKLANGWASEGSYYRVSEKMIHGADYVDWGGTGKHRANQWVTADALFVLKSFTE